MDVQLWILIKITNIIISLTNSLVHYYNVWTVSVQFNEFIYKILFQSSALHECFGRGCQVQFYKPFLDLFKC